MRNFLCIAVALSSLTLPPAAGLRAQPFGPPPTAEQCQHWSAGLAAGGEAGLKAVTYGWLAGCPSVAPAALSAAIRTARAVSDTAYLGRLVGQVAAVRDPAVFAAALEVAADRRASRRGRVMALLMISSQLGSGTEIAGRTRPQLLTEVLPATGVCGPGVNSGGPTIDHALGEDAPRRAAQVIDRIIYAQGEPSLVQNLARCARSAVGPEIPPQVDPGDLRVDYVCGDRFRIQNHTGARLTFSYVVVTSQGATEEWNVVAPAIGGWTVFDAGNKGTLRLSYDGRVVATVANAGKACDGS